jgi:hypothetical protein
MRHPLLTCMMSTGSNTRDVPPNAHARQTPCGSVTVCQPSAHLPPCVLSESDQLKTLQFIIYISPITRGPPIPPWGTSDLSPSSHPHPPWVLPAARQTLFSLQVSHRSSHTCNVHAGLPPPGRFPQMPVRTASGRIPTREATKASTGSINETMDYLKSTQIPIVA